MRDQPGQCGQRRDRKRDQAEPSQSPSTDKHEEEQAAEEKDEAYNRHKPAPYVAGEHGVLSGVEQHGNDPGGKDAQPKRPSRTSWVSLHVPFVELTHRAVSTACVYPTGSLAFLRAPREEIAGHNPSQSQNVRLVTR